MEIEDHVPEQDQGRFEDDRRVQVIEDGIELVREAIEEMGDMMPDLEVQQQLQEFIPLLQLLALVIQVLIGNLAQIQPRIEQPHIPNIHFDLGHIPRPNCQLYFHFYEEEILQMVVALQMPEILFLDNGSKVHCVEVLCITLHQLAYPCCLFDLMDVFG
ncbi:hypothetical protein CPB97_008185 [Podila verticillata]|nr:hypothetical protein CPB97_008185 [Podila verticillata]